MSRNKWTLQAETEKLRHDRTPDDRRRACSNRARHERGPGASAIVPHAADQADRAVHGRLAERRDGAAADAASRAAARPADRHRQQARRRHRDRHQGGGGGRARRLHAAVHQLGHRDRSGDEARRLRSAQGIRTGRHRQHDSLADHGVADSAGQDRSPNSSPTPRRIPARSISPRHRAPPRSWSPSDSSSSAAPTCSSSRTRAARQRCPTSSAAASRC